VENHANSRTDPRTRPTPGHFTPPACGSFSSEYQLTVINSSGHDHEPCRMRDDGIRAVAESFPPPSVQDAVLSETKHATIEHTKSVFRTMSTPRCDNSTSSHTRTRRHIINVNHKEVIKH
jgi:hypothetical protein